MLKTPDVRQTIQKMKTMITEERIELKPLNKIEMEMAQKLIDKEHPLRDTAVWVTLPCLRPCRRRIPDFVPKSDGKFNLS